jgi:ComF family protein
LLIRPIVSASLQITSRYSISVHAASSYEDPLRSLILAKNYGDRVASAQLAHIIWEHTHIRTMPCDIIIPIPLHWRRYAARGFNQATIMAETLARYNRAQVLELLSRQRNTLFQAGLSGKEREKNVKNVFVINKQYNLAGKHLVLIDDLMTTGSTLREAAQLLLPLKPASIKALVACRVIS